MIRPGAKTLSLLCVLISGASLMVTSQMVQGLEKQKRELVKLIGQEERQISFLETEWAYLTRPSRLENLVSDLGLNDKNVNNGERLATSAAQPSLMAGQRIPATTTFEYIRPRQAALMQDVVASGQVIPEPVIPAVPLKKPYVQNAYVKNPYDAQKLQTHKANLKAHIAKIDRLNKIEPAAGDVEIPASASSFDQLIDYMSDAGKAGQ